jgi:putative transposase
MGREGGSRGNYRKELFLKANTGEAFERCLLEVVDRCGWKLHAYMITRNYYHMAFETPEPNLVEGMKWLQSTFATRFNRLRKERGHVFQGCYKAILIGAERPLLGLGRRGQPEFS